MQRSVVSFILLLAISLLFFSCANIKVINEANIYSKNFLAQIEGIQLIYRDGDKLTALRKLSEIDNESISKAEKAKKYNFIGVIYFSQNLIEDAIGYFQTAKKYVGDDYYLASQINLNLASTYYKNSQYELAASTLKYVEAEYFSKREKLKFYKLNFVVSDELESPNDVVVSLMFLGKDLETFAGFESFQYKEILLDNFKKLSSSGRVHLLEKHYKNSPIVVAYLGKQEAISRYYLGDRSGAEDVLDWLDDKFSEIDSIKVFITNFNNRMANYSKLAGYEVGLVIPLSGPKGKFGKTVLTGINTAFTSKSMGNIPINVHTVDNQNTPYLSKKLIEELVMKHHVSIIIGGLFPNLAREEYLEAKKYGVFFISLSPVHLPKSEKTHLLLEIPGSVESQLSRLMSDDFLSTFGREMSVLYPRSDKGLSYVDSLWDLNTRGLIDIKGINGYERGVSEYLKPVKNLLGLAHSRERKEELKLWKDIYSINRRSVRIVNYLKPIVDYKWVFVPSFPKEAVQIIPTFSYYDAKGLTFVGDPSWLNRTLLRERKNLGKMIFVGNDPGDIDKSFRRHYFAVNNKNPRLLETMGFESVNLVNQILGGARLTQRDELSSKIMGLPKLTGVTSSWELKDGLWIKNMDLLRITRKGIKKWNKPVEKSI